jgi:hypothetical protein
MAYYSLPIVFLTFFLVPTETIVVDILRPERNREVQVFGFENVNADGVLHDGFEIVVYGDFRDVNDDKYHAFLCNPNEILFEMPSMNHAFLYEHVKLTDWMKEAKVFHPRTQESYDITRNAILKNKDRQTKRLKLRFPSEVQLSNSSYSPKSTDGEIECEFVPVRSEFVLNGRNYITTGARVSWKESVVETDKREVAASKETNRAAAKLSEKLASMRM